MMMKGLKDEKYGKTNINTTTRFSRKRNENAEITFGKGDHLHPPIF